MSRLLKNILSFDTFDPAMNNSQTIGDFMAFILAVLKLTIQIEEWKFLRHL